MESSDRAIPAPESSFRQRTGFGFGPALALTVAYWCILIALDAASDGFNIRYNDWALLPSEMWVDRVVWFGSWIAVTPLILFTLGFAYPNRLGARRTLGVHLLAHPAILGLQVLIASAVFRLLGPSGVGDVGGEAVRLFLTISLGRGVPAYAALVGIFYGLSLRKRRHRAELRSARLAAESAELSRRLGEARLEALRREMNPHLLFNALNSVGTLVRADERAKAVRMLASMSAVLRAYLRPSDVDLVPLADEIDLLDRYLEIERVRFEDRLRLRVTVDPEALGARVPPLLLQPIVENAIKHGADRSTGVTRLTIDVSVHASRVDLRVDNDSEPAPLPADTSVHSGGIGLTNLRRRLELLFGDEAGLELDTRPAGASVRVWLPMSTGDAAAVAVSRGRGAVPCPVAQP